VSLVGTNEDEAQIITEDDDNPIVELEGFHSAVKSLRIQNDGEGNAIEITGERCKVFSCNIRPIVHISGEENRFISNYLDGGDINLTSESEGNVILGNTSVGTIDNQGTGNEIDNNT